MGKYYKDEKNNLFVNPILENHDSLEEIAQSEFETFVLQINSKGKTEAEIIAEYKSYYLEKFNAKLDELDYDDIATVGVWAIKDGSQFQSEAKTLLNWYEAIINKNYEILNAVKSGDREMPTKEEYLAELPRYSTFEL